MHLHGFYFDITSRGTWAADTLLKKEDQSRVVTEMPLSGGTFAMTWVPEEPGNWLFHCHVAFHTSFMLSPTIVPDPSDPDLVHPSHGMKGMVWPSRSARGAQRLAVLNGWQGLGKSGSSPRRRGTDSRGGSTKWPSSARRGIPPRRRFGADPELAPGAPARQAGAHHHRQPDAGGDRSALARGRGAVLQRRRPRLERHGHPHRADRSSRVIRSPPSSPRPGAARSSITPTPTKPSISGGHKPRINGKSVPDTLRMRAGESYRLRLIHIIPDWTARIALLQGDSVLSWRALAKDGAKLPPHRMVLPIRVEP
jgi:manganese oxidase